MSLYDDIQQVPARAKEFHASVVAANLRRPAPMPLPSFTVMAAPPTITITLQASGTTIASGIGFGNINLFRTIGTPVISTVSGFAPTNAAGALSAAKSSAYEFWSDGTVVEFVTVQSPSSVAITVDGQLIQDAAITNDASGQRKLIKLDFSADPVPRRPRLFKIATLANLYFGGVYTDANGSVWFPQDRANRPLISFLGDSYTQGTGSIGVRNYANAVADVLNMDAFCDGLGGAGWNTASPNDPLNRFANSGAITTREPAIVCTALGYNDNNTGNVNGLKASVDATIAAIRAKWPRARVAIIGPWNPTGGTNAAIEIPRQAMIERATALGVPFIDCEGIVTPQNRAITVSGDNVHPTAYGHQHLGHQVGLRLQNAILAGL